MYSGCADRKVVKKMKTTLKGRTIVKGNVEARAIVTKTPMSFTYMDSDTGKIIDSEQEICGQSIKDKILVLPCLKGSAMQPFCLYHLVQSGTAPKGLIAPDADLRLVAAAAFCDIPLMDRLEKNPLEVISTGDIVHINATKGIIEVEK